MSAEIHQFFQYFLADEKIILGPMAFGVDLAVSIMFHLLMGAGEKLALDIFT